MNEIKNLLKKIKKFSKERDWDKFHNPKDLAISVSIETSELLEHFQWRNDVELKEYIKENKKEIEFEIADVMIYLLEMSRILKFDIIKACNDKMKKKCYEISY